MKSSRCLFSAATALQRVFIHPVESAIPQYLSRGSRYNLYLLQNCHKFSKPFAIQSRSYASRPIRDTEILNREVNVIDEDGIYHDAMPTREVLASMNLKTHSLVCVEIPPDDLSQPATAKVISRSQLALQEARESEGDREEKKGPQQRRFPRDTEIRNREVNVIDEDGNFHEAMPTRDVLATINLRTHSLVCVSMPPYDWSQPATAKVITRAQLAELAARERELAKEKKKKPENVTKTLELNWAIDNNDLGHRITKMKEFLGKGHKVAITISPKRRGRKADVEERDALLERLREVVKGEEGKRLGWSEWRQMEGKVNPEPPEEGEAPIAKHNIGVVTLHFQGKFDPDAAARENEREEEMERQMKAEMERRMKPEGEKQEEGKGEADGEKSKQGKKKKAREPKVKEPKAPTPAQLKKREKWEKKAKGELEDDYGETRGRW